MRRERWAIIAFMLSITSSCLITPPKNAEHEQAYCDYWRLETLAVLETINSIERDEATGSLPPDERYRTMQDRIADRQMEVDQQYREFCEPAYEP